ncbi:MAG: 2-amino-4-hydroxy-6-hydroxymethyldihydropteridine diphosphokinase [Fimbriimonadales bacterium]
MRAVLGLGSNVGDRLANLQAAVNFLDLRAGKVLRISGVWETSPVYVIDQDAFYNAVIEIDTALEPEQLLDVCKSVEGEVGRIPRSKWGPREIDIDLLYLLDPDGASVRVNSSTLQVPHPRMGERRFVIEPLREVDPLLIPRALDKQLLVRQNAQKVEGAKLSVHRD